MKISRAWNAVVRRAFPLPEDVRPGPDLAALLADANLQVVDVGARGSAQSVWAPLAPWTHYVACEPDPTEAARLRQALPREHPWAAVTVFEEAIARRAGSATLQLTKQPGLSSLLPPDPRVVARYYDGDEWTVASKIDVRATTLDEAATRHGFADAMFLKVDTQGSELDILESGAALVSRKLVGVQVEAEFQPFYQGQPLFADVDRWMRSQDFHLFDLQPTSLRRRGGDRASASRRQVAWAHATYLREVDWLATIPRQQQSVAASRLLAAAVAYQQHDLAFEVLSTAALDRSRADAARADLQALARARTRRHRLRRAFRWRAVEDLAFSKQDKNDAFWGE